MSSSLRLPQLLITCCHLVLGGCAADQFHFSDHPDVELKQLDDLIEDGQKPVAQRDVVDYDFSNERDEYRLGRNDKLNIYFVGHPELSSQRVDIGQISGTTIRKDGHVYLPVIGAVPAAGLTVTDFENDLREQARQYVIDPQVSVEILEHASQKFFVLGQVVTPGAFPVDGDTTLIEALSMAGGIYPHASLQTATVVREGRILPIDIAALVKHGDIRRNVYMRDGDVVFVPDGRNHRVFVLGEVQHPQVVPMEGRPLTLAEALAFAGGPTPARAKRELAVIRGGFAQPVVYRFDLSDALLVDEQVLLAPGDRVIVAPTGLSTASRYMQQILPFLLGVQALGVAAQGVTGAAVGVSSLTLPAN